METNKPISKKGYSVKIYMAKTNIDKHKEIERMLREIINQKALEDKEYANLSEEQKKWAFTNSYTALRLALLVITLDVNEQYEILKAVYEKQIKKQKRDKN